MTDSDAANYEEMNLGVIKGYIHRKYLAVADKAYKGLLDNFIVKNDDGTVTMKNI